MKKRIFLDFSIPLILLLLMTWVFRITSLDIDIQRVFYQSGKGWYLGKSQPWLFFYRYGNFPALLLVITAIVLFTAGFWLKKYLPYRKISVLLILSMLIGPGLLINAIFKDHWGRPRPRNIQEFDGSKVFLPVWDKGLSGQGKSFPCGHCSMGFYLLVPYFFFRKRKRILASLFLGTGLIYGLGMGMGRMVQGGHFPSDVLWAGGFVYFTGVSIFYALGMQQNVLWQKQKQIQKKYLPLISTALVILSLMVIFAVLLATPYNSEKKVKLKGIKGADAVFDFDEADISIRSANKPVISWLAHGFGFPGKDLISVWQLPDKKNNYQARFNLSKKGLFTELNNSVKLRLPLQSAASYSINLNDGELVFIIPEKNYSADIRFFIHQGAVILKLRPTAEFYLVYQGEKLINNSSIKFMRNKNHVYTDSRIHNRINVTIEKGELILEDLK